AHLLGRAAEFRPQLRLLGRDAGGAGIEVALPGHVAPDRYERGRAEPVALGAEQRGNHDVSPGAQPAVHPHLHAVAQSVLDQDRLGFREPQLPWRARVLDRRQRRRSRPTVVAGGEHVVGVRLGDTRGDPPDTRFRHQLHAHARVGVDLLQIVDELRQVLDRIDVVVRRRRDKRNPRYRVAQTGDKGRDLVGGELSPFAGLRALRDLDLELVGTHQIVRGDPKPPRRDLLDAVIGAVAVLERDVRIGVFAALTRVRARAHPVHADRERAVRLGGQRAERHGGRYEAATDLLRGLDLVERNRRHGAEREQVAWAGGQPGRDAGPETVICLGCVGLYGGLHRPHQLWRPAVILAVAPVADAPVVGQHRLRRRFWIRGPVARQDVLGDLGEPDPTDRRDGPC